MSKKSRLTKRQLDVIDALFAGEPDHRKVFEKHKVSPRLYSKWQDDPAFIKEFERRVAAAYRCSAALVVGYAPVAATKLVQLTDSDKPETARKACLDVISMPGIPAGRPAPPSQPPAQLAEQPLDPKTASKILAILAEERQRQGDKS